MLARSTYNLQGDLRLRPYFRSQFLMSREKDYVVAILNYSLCRQQADNDRLGKSELQESERQFQEQLHWCMRWFKPNSYLPVWQRSNQHCQHQLQPCQQPSNSHWRPQKLPLSPETKSLVSRYCTLQCSKKTWKIPKIVVISISWTTESHAIDLETSQFWHRWQSLQSQLSFLGEALQRSSLQGCVSKQDNHTMLDWTTWDNMIQWQRHARELPSNWL